MAPPAAPRVVFLNRFYWPDVAATAQMLTDLAEDLAVEGWQVTVVTSDSAYDGNAAALPPSEVHNGVRIIRTSGTRFGRHRLAGRMLDYLSYIAGAFRHLMRLERHDAVVGMSDPPFIIAVAMIVAKLRGWKSVYWVQDLFPQIAGELGVLRPKGVAYHLADRAARWINRRVDLVIALGPRMAQRMEMAGAPAERVTFVHNWADAEAIRPIPNGENPFLREQGLEGKFVVLYSGNAGRPHRFDGVMQAAELLLGETDVVFLFIGGGKRTPDLQREVSDRSLTNVRFLGYLPREQLAYSLSAANVSLVTEDPSMVGLLVPSKTYGILASGRPLVFMGDGKSDVAAVVRETESGFVLSPDDGHGLRERILSLRGNPLLAGQLGRNARRAAETLYDRHVGTSEWGSKVRQCLADALTTRKSPG